MSKLSEYSKFDKLDDDDSLDDNGDNQSTNDVAKQPSFAPAGQQEPQSTLATPPLPTPQPTASATVTGSTMRKSKETGRFVFEHNGKPVYEWEQNLEEVILYLQAPPVPPNQIHCQILPHHLQLGIQKLVTTQAKYFLDEDTFGTVDVSESTWTLEDGMLVIYLAKANKAQVWDMALKGNKAATAELDPMAKQQVQKEMMLERFQEENPGMDFRSAEFNGGVPDPRTFMGGIKYD